MDNEVMALLEMLYTMVSEAWGVPLGNEKCIIERDKVLSIIEEIKAQMPVELAEAKRLVSARDEFIGNAKREAESIRRAAEEKARTMIDQQEIVRVSRAQSEEMLSTAEAKSKELRRVANEYVDEAMRRTEEVLSSALKEVHESRGKFRGAAAAAAQKLNMQPPAQSASEPESAPEQERVMETPQTPQQPVYQQSASQKARPRSNSLFPQQFETISMDELEG